jgi:hypothetical protein
MKDEPHRKPPMEFTLKTDEGNYDIEAGVRLIGVDVLVAIRGGRQTSHRRGCCGAALSQPA